MTTPDFRRIETPLGPVDFHGRDTGLPVMLFITGAFAPAHQFAHMQGLVSGADVWRAHLPGNHCPPLATTSIGAFGFAFSHAIGLALAGRPIAVIGNSAGALAALAMDQRLIRRMLLIEPPLHPTLVWMFDRFTRMVPPGGEDFAWQVLGAGPAGRAPRDYRGLLTRLRKPALVLAGDAPLMPRRAFDPAPSVLDEESRQLLAAHPLVDLRIIPGAGHNILAEQRAAYRAALRSILN